MSKKFQKLFVVKKYIYASSAKEAIRKDKKEEVHDVWWDEEHKKRCLEPRDAIGFEVEKEEC